MENIFIKLLNMSISASWVILAILLLRVLLKKAPKGICCCLWALAAIRLLCPMSPESALSLIPSTNPVPREILYDTNPAIESNIDAVNNAINPILSSSFAPDPGDSVNPLQVIAFLASRLWFAGMILMLAYALISCLKLRRRVAPSIRLKDNILLCDSISSPFIFGILFPRIYLPSDLQEPQLSFVVAHEKAHLKRHDHWWKPLGFLLLSVYWFNPLCWAAYILLCRDIELACDEYVVRSMEKEEQKNYAETLLSWGITRRMISACPLAFGEISVKERVRTVLNYRRPSFWIALVGMIACTAAAVCFLTNPLTENKDIFGARYQVAEVLYDAPWYDFTYTADNAPKYAFTSDHSLMEYCQDSPLGNSSWTFQGGFGTVEYSWDTLYSLFVQEDSDSVSARLSDTAGKKLDRVEKIWRVNTLDETDRFYLAMETKDREVLLAMGYGKGEDSRIRWLWKMERISSDYSQEYLAGLIASMCGSDVSIFGIYESDSMPGKLLAGFQEQNYNRLGFAMFNCSDPTDSYSCAIRGFKTFPKSEALSICTIGEDWGIDHSITIILSSMGNLARLTAESDDMVQNATPGSVTPAMIVFEWPDLLPQEEAAGVKIIAHKQTNADIYPPESEDGLSGSPASDSGSPESEIPESLNAAVSSAIMEHCAAVPPYGSQPQDDSLFLCESHRPMSIMYGTLRSSGNLSFLDGISEQTEVITVYAMVMYQVYHLSPEGIQEVLSRYFPAMLTFVHSEDAYYESLSDTDTSDNEYTRNTVNEYILADFWEPEGIYTGTDREAYEKQLRRTFPAHITEEAILSLTSQAEIDALRQACYAQAVEYGNIDTDSVIDGLFEAIMSAGPGTSSNPYDYLTASPAEHMTLHYYGDYTLRYITSELQKDSQTGLKGQLMKIIMEELSQRGQDPATQPIQDSMQN